MIEQYLRRSKKLFDINNNIIRSTLPLEDCLINFKDDFIEVDVSQIYIDRENTYTLSGMIVYNDRLFEPETKLETINTFFFENQKTINKCVEAILKKAGLPAHHSKSGLYLGNNRAVSTNGLWFMYHTNKYQFSNQSEFEELMIEETNVVSSVFSVTYALVQYIIEQKPALKDIIEITKKYDKFNTNDYVIIPDSPLVIKYLDADSTIKRKNLFFQAVGYVKSAEELVQNNFNKSKVNERN